MDLALTEDQLALQESVRDVLQRECPMTLVRRVVEEGKDTDELWNRMVELDWPALMVPEEHGGLGLGFVEVAVVAEQLGYVLAPAPFQATAVQFVAAVAAAGNAEQRERFLGGVARDGVVGTLALAEAAGSFDPARVAAAATRDGDGWVISGEKHFVFDGARAEEIVVAARVAGSQGDEGLALFVVPQAQVTAEPMMNLDASRGYATVVVDLARVGADRVLGEPGAMAPVLWRIAQEATTALAVELVGTCQAIFDIVKAYVSEREQFGVKVGSFQAVKHKLANMYVALESARAAAYFAAAAIAESDERRDVAVAVAKASSGDCQKLVAQEGIQLLGGIGYTWEHDMHLYVKRAKASAALFGNAGEHLATVARLIGL
ncbi:MAG TPA: acyl-CoA dehydrogenase family protein [Acidimicrobiales bacterium]|nr:acyl-CoA dehydrogenase family protein [Acidimicrobiales bacterium]